MDPKVHAQQIADMAARRNFGIMAHIDAGKTTVSERILYFTGRIRKVQEVHEGAATMDYMEEERERGITGADFEAAIQSIKTRLGAKPVPIQIPHVVEQQLAGCVDLVAMDYVSWTPEGDMSRGPIPAELQEKAKAARTQLIEDVAEYSDALMENYLQGEEVSNDEIKLAIRKGTIIRHMFPCLAGAALRNRGVQPLLDAICDYLPSPLDLADIKGTKGPRDHAEVTRKHDENEPFCGLAFKTINDPNGDLTFVRVYSGVLNRGDEVYNSGKQKYERIGRLLRMHANQREPMERVRAGDICAVIGLKQTYTGDTLCSPDHAILLESMKFPDTVISQSIAPKNNGDRDKLSEALGRLAKEDPTFRRFTDEETNETIIAGMGELHLEIISSRLQREFRVEVVTGRPRVAYRQTIARTVEIEGKHVKQSGGSGQYGVVYVKFEPVAGSTEVEFVNEIVGGAIPKEFIPAVEDGIIDTCAKGGDLKLPIVGLRATLIDGKYHEVDSNEMAFKTAGFLAVRGALEQGGLVILEPLMKLEVNVPDEFLGAVLGDLNSRRMQIEDLGQGAGNLRTIRGKVPIAEMFQYSTTLRSFTQGRGVFSMEPSEYAPVPRSLQEVVVKEQRERKEKKK
jgi:elongation factor G